MKSILFGCLFLGIAALFATGQTTPQKQNPGGKTAVVNDSTIVPAFTKDPVVNLRLSLPQASQVIYAIRYSQILDASTANQLADYLVKQIQDTTLNKPIASPPGKQK